MSAFMDKDFLLTTKPARKLFHDYAECCPIIDYHCHVSPREIWDDRRFENITQVWLGGDHYKWRLMRWAGTPEKYITGDASDYEKFEKWAGVIGKAIGNPLYHWTHLELKRYFGYDGVLSAKTAREVWEICNTQLNAPGFSVRELITRSNVKAVCTTDDPIDTLEWHAKLAKDDSFKTVVLPALRPDKAMNIEKPDYLDYIAKLADASGIAINSFGSLKAALINRIDFFAKHGCTLSDHALPYVMCEGATDAQIEAIFAARVKGETPCSQGIAQFKTAFMRFVAGEYRARNWVMQIHYGCKRDNNVAMFNKLGPDTGYDAIDNHTPSAQLADFLNLLTVENALPKTIVYSLNPQDDTVIDSIIGAFENSEAVCKVQHGSAWWFNDHLEGMTAQIKSLANLGYLAGFVGMLTDSRSFLSYPRHEYFRRILCRIIGEWVDEGQFPDDDDTLKSIVEGVCYGNAKGYFGFPEK